MATTVRFIRPGIARIKCRASFQEVRTGLGRYGLPVEPLSEKISINQFIRQGGIGYNSLLEGSIGSKVFQASFIFSGNKVTYGSKHKTLYNAGYPLHRFIEGPSFSKPLTEKIDRIEEIVLPVKAMEEVRLSFLRNQIHEFHVPGYASNVFFINAFGAGLMGLKEEGLVVTHADKIESNTELEPEIWEKRFIEDLIPPDHSTIKFFTMKSRLEEIFQVFTEDADGLFFALSVNKGILLLLSGKVTQIDRIREKIKQKPLTFEIMT